jgi:Rad3-related DNA helicase
VARTIVRLMAHHPDEKGLVHAHSYAISDRLVSLLNDFGVGDRVRTHDKENRDAALEGWKQSDGSDLFVSVKMEEALDLKGDLCRWQVLCKAPYPNTRDSRVSARLEEGQWAWYYRTALRTVIQACGRVVRAPDDYGATYLADSSLLDLFERAQADTPGWFTEQVDRVSTPDLPAFDPSAAVESVGGSASGAGGLGGSSGSSASSAGSRSGSRSGSSSSSSSADDDYANHPLSDVWGE